MFQYNIHVQVLKQILSLPTMVADCGVYIISDMVPIEATIHKRALNFYWSICRLLNTAVEKWSVHRQLCVKSFKSHSWFIVIKRLHLQYGLPNPCELLSTPPPPPPSQPGNFGSVQLITLLIHTGRTRLKSNQPCVQACCL